MDFIETDSMITFKPEVHLIKQGKVLSVLRNFNNFMMKKVPYLIGIDIDL